MEVWAYNFGVHPGFLHSHRYYLDDLTARKYGDPENGDLDVLGSEKQEFLARLGSVKDERERGKNQ